MIHGALGFHVLAAGSDLGHDAFSSKHMTMEDLGRRRARTHTYKAEVHFQGMSFVAGYCSELAETLSRGRGGDFHDRLFGACIIYSKDNRAIPSSRARLSRCDEA